MGPVVNIYLLLQVVLHIPETVAIPLRVLSFLPVSCYYLCFA